MNIGCGGVAGARIWKKTHHQPNEILFLLILLLLLRAIKNSLYTYIVYVRITHGVVVVFCINKTSFLLITLLNGIIFYIYIYIYVLALNLPPLDIKLLPSFYLSYIQNMSFFLADFNILYRNSFLWRWNGGSIIWFENRTIFEPKWIVNKLVQRRPQRSP